MSVMQHFTEELPCNPLDTLELVASAHNWSFERAAECELDCAIDGLWGEYAISMNWRDDLEVLHLAAQIDIRVPPGKRYSLVDLLALVNEQMYMGHFDLWSNEGMILYRHSLMLQGGAQATPLQCEELISVAVAACDRFFPAFQYLIWAGQSPKDALAAAMFDTDGQA